MEGRSMLRYSLQRYRPVVRHAICQMPNRCPGPFHSCWVWTRDRTE